MGEEQDGRTHTFLLLPGLLDAQRGPVALSQELLDVQKSAPRTVEEFPIPAKFLMALGLHFLR